MIGARSRVYVGSRLDVEVAGSLHDPHIAQTKPASATKQSSLVYAKRLAGLDSVRLCQSALRNQRTHRVSIYIPCVSVFALSAALGSVLRPYLNLRTLTCLSVMVASSELCTQAFLQAPSSNLPMTFYTRTYAPQPPMKLQAALVHVHAFLQHSGRYTRPHTRCAAAGFVGLA